MCLHLSQEIHNPIDACVNVWNTKGIEDQGNEEPAI